MSDEQKFEPFRELIPEGAIPLYGFLMVRYLRASDDPHLLEEDSMEDRCDWTWVGDKIPLVLAVGDLELAKWGLVEGVGEQE